MKMPKETIERLNSRCRKITDLSMNMKQLQQQNETTRREWWYEILRDLSEYNSIRYDQDECLESHFALARLKLLSSFLENGEIPPKEHCFCDEEVNLLKEFEQYTVYDRLSVEEVKNFVHLGTEDDKGVVALAKHAAASGYDKVYKLMQQRNLSDELTMALHRIYHDRIRKMEAAVTELMLNESYRDMELAGEASIAR